MTSDATDKDKLRERLARLDTDQIADVVLGLQARIDKLRADRAAEIEPVAVVGMACRFPHGDGLNDYRRMLYDGENAVDPPPADRPEAKDLPPAGYLDGIDRFDAGFFGFRDLEAAAMDPQHRLVMELAWHALEDAGYADKARRARQTGIYLGLSTSDYEERFRGSTSEAFTPQAITGNARSIAAGRLAHWLDTTGPALTLDTACSSSLVAVHAACLALRAGACDMAIAGGVNTLLENDLTDGFKAAGMLSPDHACKTFDAAANGYVRGEGGGMVVVKRLSDAEADGDRIRAVIRGGAINHDGHASALTAPNGPAQVAVIRAALADAGLAPADIQAIECHGTGTSLGDPIEVQALAEAYGRDRQDDLLLGSVKTNIGHLEAAAGIAGLIKMVLALQSARLPATLHQVSPNPRIAWDQLPVRVTDQTTDWPAGPVRRAGISSFGFSGTNAHLILESAPEAERETAPEPSVCVLPLSAPDRDGLARLAGTIARDMAADPGLEPAGIATALAIGRQRFAERAAVTGASRDDMITDLEAIADGDEPTFGAIGTASPEQGKIAFLFTGQGSQWSGMGHDLYQTDPPFKAIVDRCAAQLEPHLPHPLTTLMFDPAFEDQLLDTAIAQPALFVLEYALAKRLMAWGVMPDIMIGHSLGELVAACLAGVITLDDALVLTAKRGALMGALPRDGAMAAVFAPVSAIEPVLAPYADRVDIAAVNGPEDTVISGEAASVDAICDVLDAQDIGCQRLRVSHAFHSCLMEPAMVAFRDVAAGIDLSAPRTPVVSNVTATTDARFTDAAYWSDHIREPVRFADGMAAVVAEGATVLVEIGAASALIGMAQRSPDLAERDLTFVPTLRRNRPGALGLGAALARLFVAGASIEWPALLPAGRRANVPGYPFADTRHWTPRPTAVAGVAPSLRDETSAAPAFDTRPANDETLDPDDLRCSVRTLLGRALQLDETALESDVGFFELGVDSLALTEAVARIERRWQIAIPRDTLFVELDNAVQLVGHVVEAIASRSEQPATDTAEPAAPQQPPTAPGEIVTTPSQRALWYLAAFSPETSAAYNQSLVLDLKGDLDEAALSRAVHALIDRHDSLRTTFSSDGERLRVHEAKPIAIEPVDMKGSDAVAADAWLRAEAARPFDLEAGPLLRAALLRLSAEHVRFVLIQPHIVTDGWSMQVQAVELGMLYSAIRAGRAPSLAPAPAFQVYADFARKLAGAPEAATYWRGLYANLPPILDLPADRPRPKLQSYGGERVLREVPAALAERLTQRARDAGCSLFTLCLAGYARLLSQLSGQDDLAIAIFSAGQPLVAERWLTGYCVTTLPIRLRGAGTPSDRELVAVTHSAMADALAHPGYAFSSLVKDLRIKRDPSRAPLTGVSFNLNRIDTEPHFDGLVTGLEANDHGSVRWDLNWNLMIGPRGLQIEANFASSLFDHDRVEDWVSTYVAILEALCDDPNEATQEPDKSTGPETETLAHWVAAWAATSPNAIAVRDQEGATSYAALDRMASTLAGRLTAAGISRGHRVAFKLERGLGPVVVMLATARLGAAFVPLDPDHPTGHHANILSDSGARLLITDSAATDNATSVSVIVWQRGDDAASSDDQAPRRVASDDLAYVLYTSGSTGRPKGVMVPWRAVSAYVTGLLARLGSDGPMSFAMVTSFAADLGYTSVFGALRLGGTLHAVDTETARDPNRLIRWLRHHPVDAMKIVPTHMAALMTAPDAQDLLPLNALIFGGDVLNYDLVDRVRALDDGCRIFNHYGPTEATIGATMIEVTNDLWRSGETTVPIGRPLDGYTVEIVAEDGRPVEPGETGEVRIGGPAVAAGYVSPHGDEAARFSRGENGDARYATGDLGRQRDDGVIVFAGRKDDMVKIRGHQVDPTGIAALLRTHPKVRDAALVVDRQNGNARLLAGVVTDETAETIGAWLSGMVPAAMCPAQMTVLDALPLNANGKLDRTALLQRMGRSRTDGALVAASDGSPIETICAIWRDVLNVDQVGPTDDFFELGGDSIMAIQIAGKARSAGLTISPAQIFEHASPLTLAAMAVAVDDDTADRSVVTGAVPLTPIQRWFMAIEMAKRDQWTLTAVFDVPSATTPAHVNDALAVLIDRHDALRTALRQGDGVESQQIVDPPPDPMVITREIDSENAAAEAENELADSLIAGLNLAQGRVIGAGLITSPSRTGSRLVLAAHHFAFDVVSWGIVAQDLEMILTEGARAVAPVATPWSWWCSKLAAYAEAARPQLDYWQSVETAGSSSIPLDRPDGADAERDAVDVERDIDPDVTHALLALSAETYGMQAHEIVLAAIGRALVGWTQQPTIVELEGHGREPLDPTVDLSRTVGWFTTRYPLALPLDRAGDPRDWLVAIKEAVRKPPQHGMGYGLLRYIDGADLSCRPTVSYNFVGDLNRFGGELGLVRLGAGQQRDPEAQRPHLLSFIGWLDNGALHLRCQHAGQHTTATVTGLLDAIMNEVAALAEHCATAASRVYTPGDFADVDFSQDELDQLTADILGSD